MSLSAHLTSGTAGHGRLRFRADCPRCRAERLAGSLGADALVSRRTQAALAAGVLALSATAPPAAALASEVDREQEGSGAPGGDQPGLEPDFDPGGDDTLDVDTAPLQGGPEPGGQEDDGQGAPVEAEPTEDPEARLLLDGGAEPAPAQPAVPDPTPPPTVPPTAAPPPPPAELEAVPPPEPPTTSTKRKAPKRAPKPRQRAPMFVSKPSPAAAPVSPAPVVEAAAPTPTAATVPVSQPSEPPDPVTGPSYTVRPGDSLWSIARRLLGGSPSAGRVAREVNRLWELNQERIGTGNPSLVHVGIVLRLR